MKITAINFYFEHNGKHSVNLHSSHDADCLNPTIKHKKI
jgi:hypothetical protein